MENNTAVINHERTQGVFTSLIQSASVSNVLLTLTLAAAGALISIGFHRLYLHPLRHIPGPRLAALSSIYAFYWNYFRGGYSKQFARLHKEYNSSVIRISPRIVHSDSLELYETIFASGSTWLKDPVFYEPFGGIDNMTNPQDYRVYHHHIASMYSTRAVETQTSRLLLELQLIGKRMRGCIGTDKAFNATRWLRSLSGDIILNLLFSHDIVLATSEEYHPFLKAFDVVMEITWIAVTWPLLLYPLAYIPGSGFKKVMEAFDFFVKNTEEWTNEDKRIMASGTEKARDSHMKRYLDIDPKDEKTRKVIPIPADDVFNWVSGGTDTTAYSMACCMHYLLTTPDALAKLQNELDEAISYIRDDFNSTAIQTLPYLNAVIKEALRLSSPVPGINPRIAPSSGAQVGTISIPPGTSVSVTALSVHQNPKIYPQPQKFIPERWLGDSGRSLEKYHVPFQKGPRQCPGINLANFELRCSIAYFFSRFELALASNLDKGNALDWIDRFVAASTEDVQVRVLKDKWLDGAV